MKAKRFLDLAAASRSLLFAWATRALVVLGLLLLPMGVELIPETGSGATAHAAPPPDKGPPDNPGPPSGTGAGSGDLYSDLVVTYRNLWGLPIFVDVPAGTEEEEGEALAEGYVACEQPITGFEIVGDSYLDYYANWLAIDLSTNDYIGNPLLNLADDREVSPIPLGGTGVAGEECDVAYDPGENPDYDYTMYPQEVHFGRINVGRSPDKVLDRQLRDVLSVMQDAELGWDFAGRITVNGTAIDSPLQSLAIYRELMISRDLQTKTGGYVLPGSLPWHSPGKIWFSFAATALGAAVDKGVYYEAGGVTLDLVVYNNRILDIPNLIQENSRVIPGTGILGALDERYVNYGMYNYHRAWKYRGCARGLTVNGVPFKDTIFNLVFGGSWFEATNIFAFATEADDARRVIAFVHDTSTYIVQEIDRAGENSVCVD